MNDELQSNSVNRTATDTLDYFYVPAAVSFQERHFRTLKQGNTFAVFDQHGDVLSGPGNPQGLYHLDTRYLSHMDLAIGGTRPILLSSTLRDNNATLTCDVTNPDLFDGPDLLVLSHDIIHIRRSKFLWDAVCFEHMAVRNFDIAPKSIRIEIRFAADFADLFEVRGATRKQRGRFYPPKVDRERVTLSYGGLDGRRRTTSVCFRPQPQQLDAQRAVFEINLEPGGRAALFVEIRCDEDEVRKSTPKSVFSTLRDARRALQASSLRAARVETSNEIFNEAIRRSISDLYMLITDLPNGPYPYAGIPWFSAVFGRDGLITAQQTLWLDPAIARGVLSYLAENQATEEDPEADAEPGKILHEVRHGEMAELGEVPFRKYYGSVDSTPLFVMLAGDYVYRTGDLKMAQRLWPNIKAALKWIEEYGDRDGDGFVEYGRKTPEGLVNQGWKDSQDSIFHKNGKLPRGPVAVCEVQAYVFGALRAAAYLAGRLGYADEASGLIRKSEELQARFDAAFWDEEMGSYVLALDGQKRPCRVRASNAGHALFTGIAYPERAFRVAELLMNGVFFSGWGIRTLATGEPRYNPMSYHNGSVWPHDNAMIARGFARYGFRQDVVRILEGLFDVSIYTDLRRLPELFCGFPRREGRGPTLYPVACSPQAWAATAPLSLLQTCLGLGFDPERRQVVFDHPILPAFLDEVTLRGVAIGDASVDVLFGRTGQGTAMTVLSRQGDIRVLMES